MSACSSMAYRKRSRWVEGVPGDGTRPDCGSSGSKRRFWLKPCLSASMMTLATHVLISSCISAQGSQHGACLPSTGPADAWIAWVMAAWEPPTLHVPGLIRMSWLLLLKRVPGLSASARQSCCKPRMTLLVTFCHSRQLRMSQEGISVRSDGVPAQCWRDSSG